MRPSNVRSLFTMVLSLIRCPLGLWFTDLMPRPYSPHNLTNPAHKIGFYLGLVLAIGWAPSAVACGACWQPRKGLDVMHPMSINVAVATRTACQEGRLPADLSFETDRANQFRRWTRVVEFARKIAEAHSADGSVSMHLICVDSSLRTYFRLEGGRAEELPLLSRTPGLNADLTIVTSETALLALLTGSLSFHAAVQQELVHVEDADAATVVYPIDPFAATVASVDETSETSFLTFALVLAGLALPIALAVFPQMKRKDRRVHLAATT